MPSASLMDVFVVLLRLFTIYDLTLCNFHGLNRVVKLRTNNCVFLTFHLKEGPTGTPRGVLQHIHHSIRLVPACRLPRSALWDTRDFHEALYH